MAKKTFDKLIQRNDEAMPVIEILPEFQDLIPPLKTDEFQQLEQNIIAEGCREPLIIWENEGVNYLVDGHNRYQICAKNNLPFQVVKRNFKDLDDAKDWMIRNQLGRRNLTQEQISYLRGKQYESEKKRHGGAYNSPEIEVSGQTTAEKIATEHQVSRETIKRDEKFARALDKLGDVNPDLKRAILGGKEKVKKNVIQAVERIENPSALAGLQSADELTDYIKIATYSTAPPETPPAPKKPKADTTNIKKQIALAIDRFIEQPDDQRWEDICRELVGLKHLLTRK